VTTWRRSSYPPSERSARVGATALAALLAFVLGVVVMPTSLLAQSVGGTSTQSVGSTSAQNTVGVMHFPPRPPPPPRQPAPPSNAPMLVQATEIRYDYTKITRLPRSATCRSITAARLSKPIRSHTIKKRSDCARRATSG